MRTLTAQADFAAIYAGGQKKVSRSFVLFFRPHLAAPHGAQDRPHRGGRERVDFCYAVVASRKTIGNAVHRNRAKRLLRELLRAAAEDGGLRLQGDLLLVARAALLERKFADLKEELAQCLKNWLSV
ncbi:MAG: ribonuclease P protein component [Candidatus Margulisbacteria bacterium]|nr:ribonuclease P protein component [Candidatus Margulisiibacteriota bacterium]